MPKNQNAPEGWSSTTLGLACEVNPKKPRLAGVPDDAQVLFVPMASVDELTGEITAPHQKTLGDVRNKSYTTFAPGDVLFAKITPCMENGKAAVVPAISSGLGFGSTEFHVLRPTEGVNPRFIWHLVRQESFRRDAEAHMTGTVGQARVPAAFLDNFPIFLPPEPLQSEIVEVLDATQKIQRTAVGHLVSAKLAIDHFHHSLLIAACSGRLTADWRVLHPGDSASLVQSLRSRFDGRPLRSPRPRELAAIDIPDEWSMVPIELLVDKVEAGKSFTCLPRRASEDEWGVIRVSAMSWGSFRPEEHKAVPNGRSINPKHEIHPGDLLISRANTVELVGATVLVNATRPRLLLSDKSLRLIPHPKISKQWLNYALGSPMTRRQFGTDATGTSDSMRNLSQKKILGAMVGLPPTDEQEEIVRRVSDLMRRAEEITATITAIEWHINGVCKGVLANVLQRADTSADDSNPHGA